MALLAAFLAIAIVGQVANVAICLLLERFFPGAFTLAVFFVSWIGVFWLAWRLALRVTEPRSNTAPSADEQQLLVFLTTAMHAPMVV